VKPLGERIEGKKHDAGPAHSFRDRPQREQQTTASTTKDGLPSLDVFQNMRIRLQPG
jgi:hypothetical protein